MRRMHTDYLDIVYCHDVEFVDFEQVVGPNQALEAVFDLKSKGKIKYVGCSGMFEKKKKNIERSIYLGM